MARISWILQAREASIGRSGGSGNGLVLFIRTSCLVLALLEFLLEVVALMSKDGRVVAEGFVSIKL